MSSEKRESALRVEFDRLRTKNCLYGFDCGERTINRWAQNTAFKMDATDRVRVVTAYDAAGGAPYGFVAMSFTHQDQGKLLDQQDRDRWRKDAPLVYLDYLAVEKSIHGRRLGSNLLIEALSRAYAVSQLIPVYGVCLNSLNTATTSFYEKMGFRSAPGEERSANPLMIIPIWTVQDLLG